MSIKRVLKIAVIANTCLLLGACATEPSEVSDANLKVSKASAISQGAGDVSSFYDETSAHRLEVGDQTAHFDFNKSIVRDEDKPTLLVQAHYLIAHPQAKLLIAGNTDERGSREYNIGLGQRRALSVQQFLVENGVSPKQLLTVSYGAEKPVVFGHSEADYAKNRRADLQYQSPIITDKT